MRECEWSCVFITIGCFSIPFVLKRSTHTIRICRYILHVHYSSSFSTSSLLLLPPTATTTTTLEYRIHSQLKRSLMEYRELQQQHTRSTIDDSLIYPSLSYLSTWFQVASLVHPVQVNGNELNYDYTDKRTIIETTAPLKYNYCWRSSVFFLGSLYCPLLHISPCTTRVHTLPISTTTTSRVITPWPEWVSEWVSASQFERPHHCLQSEEKSNSRP